jgi:hypothetical protein
MQQETKDEEKMDSEGEPGDHLEHITAQGAA